jgi:hypothetical protein
MRKEMNVRGIRHQCAKENRARANLDRPTRMRHHYTSTADVLGNIPQRRALSKVSISLESSVQTQGSTHHERTSVISSISSRFTSMTSSLVPLHASMRIFPQGVMSSTSWTMHRRLSCASQSLLRYSH